MEFATANLSKVTGDEITNEDLVDEVQYDLITSNNNYCWLIKGTGYLTLHLFKNISSVSPLSILKELRDRSCIFKNSS